MRLAYLSNFFPSLTETFIYREVIELRRRGMEILTYSLRRPDPSGISGESLALHTTTHYVLPVTFRRLLFCHLGFFLGSPVAYAGTLLRMITGTHRHGRDRIRSLMHFGEGVVLAEKMRHDRVTHVHAHFASQAASVARVIHLLTGIPFSFTGHAHDIWWDQLLLPEKLKEAEFVVTCSDFGRRSLIGMAREDVSRKVHLVYHGLDVDNFPYGSNGRERNLLLSIGRLAPVKGFPDLVKACALLKSRGFPFRCVIVGDGEDREELEKLIQSSHLSDDMVLTGAVPQEQARAYYRQAWIFVLPCVDTPDGNRDGIPNVLMEAMATGLPVITTTNSGQAELVRHGIDGLLVPQRSPEKLADEIIRLCEQRELRQTLVAEARKTIVEKFDNRKTIEPLIELFQRHVYGQKQPKPH